MTFLSGSEVLARLDRTGSMPCAGSPAGAASSARALPEELRRGIEAAAFRLWLEPAKGSPAAPTPDTAAALSSGPDAAPPAGTGQIVLRTPPGRYRIEYWDTAGKPRLLGVETGTAAPLVVGPPPDCAAPLLVLVIPFV